MYVALATPTQERGAIDPASVDLLDISVIAALLGIDREDQTWQDDWGRMNRLRLEAAEKGLPAPTWEEVTANG